jgi:hypothetical protein
MLGKNKTKKDSSKSFNIFCENCDNILDISRFNVKNGDTLDSETPKNLSSNQNSDEDVNYESFLKKIEDGEKLSNDDLKSINIKEMVNNDYYKKMSKKGEIKKSIIDMIDDMGNSDDNTQAYMICKNCSFNKTIDPGFRILSKNPEGVTTIHDYVNEASYRNKVHIRTIPITRNFNCPNTECPVYKKMLPPEAIFFRKHANTHETVYVCKRCLSIKMN